MLENMRQGAQSRFAKIILALIMVPFALWGVDSYIDMMGKAGGVATVGNSTISSQEFNQALRQSMERARAQFGALDPGMAENPQFRRAVLDDLVNRRVLLSAAADADLAVSDKVLAREIAALPAFQDDGKFSRTRYEGILKSQQMTPLAFEASLRQDLLLQDLHQGIAGSAFVSATAVDQLIGAAEQKREVAVVTFPPEQFAAQAKAGDEDIKAYYAANQAQFTVPDQVRLEYVVLSSDELAKQMTASADEVKKLYDERSAQYRQAEERRASHILITVDEKASEDEKKAALAKADAVAAEAKQKPERFAELAKKHSQDPGSAQKSGDLGSFARGMMVKPFDDAVFSMQKGEISRPVQSEFGYHVIHLTDIQAERVRPLDEVKAELEQEVKKQKAARKVSEIAEPFANLVYEQSASLKPAADAHSLPIRESEWISRKGGAKVPELNHEKLLAAVFSDEVLKNKRNTEAIEVAPSTLVAGRVIDFKPSFVKPLAEVADQIKADLTRQQASKLAIEKGRETLAQLVKGEQPQGLQWQGPQQVSRQQPGNLTPPVLEAAFKLSPKSLPAYTGAETPFGGFSIVRLTRVADGETGDAAKRKSYAERLKQERAEAQFSALLASLRSGTEVRFGKEWKAGSER